MKSLRVAFIATLLLAACSPSKKTDDGGQHGGGGNLRKSTSDQVHNAIAQAYSLATNPSPRRNIFVRYWRAAGEKNRNIPQDEVTASLKDVYPSQPDRGAIKALRENEPMILESGDCQQPDQSKHADASVSQLNLQGKVCFSIENISRVPPEDLLKEVLSLLLHEAVHLAGGNERQANLWQDAFAKFYAGEFNLGVNHVGLSQRSRTEIIALQSDIRSAIELNEKSPGDPRIYGIMGMAVVKLNNLPSYLDPIMLEIGLPVGVPDAIDNYPNAVIATIEKIQNDFQLPETLRFTTNAPTKVLNPQEIDASLREIAKYLKIVLQNLRALLRHPILGSTIATSKCLLPTSPAKSLHAPIQRHTFYDYTLSREMPPLECAKLINPQT